jgi:hypothetical protein
VDLVRTDVSEELVSSIFREEKTRKKEKSVSKRLTLFSLAYFSILKMEATRSSETLVLTRYTRRHIPEDSISHSTTVNASNPT